MPSLGWRHCAPVEPSISIWFTVSGHQNENSTFHAFDPAIKTLPRLRWIGSCTRIARTGPKMTRMGGMSPLGEYASKLGVACCEMHCLARKLDTVIKLHVPTRRTTVEFHFLEVTNPFVFWDAIFRPLLASYSGLHVTTQDSEQWQKGLGFICSNQLVSSSCWAVPELLSAGAGWFG